MHRQHSWRSVPSRGVFVVLTFALCATTTLWAQTEVQSVLPYLERVRDETGAPGISVAVAKNGQIVFSGGVGYAELDNRTPADGATVHNVGSVSKVLAAVAVMHLVEQGKVSLDDRIQQYVPLFPEKRGPITLRQILTHTSGVRHYRDGEFGPHRLRSMQHFDDFTEAIKHFTEDPLLFEPGEYWFYSSHAFNLLQGVVETASGMGFEAYMRTYVWRPAGMLNSSFDAPDRIVYKRGRGYARNSSGTLVNSRYEDVSYKYAGGGMLSTVEDLVRFGMAINDGRLLEPETVAQMHSVHIAPVIQFVAGGEPREREAKQALGWDVQTDIEGRSYISKTGTVRGTRSVVVNYPDRGLVVALQANIAPFPVLETGQEVAQMFLEN